MQNITKEFPGVKALDAVCLNLRWGELHALCGENGADKSTLIKVVSGEHPQYTGKLLIHGNERKFYGIKESEEAGIASIHQELGLISTMSVCEHIFLGDEICNAGFIDWDQQFAKRSEWLTMLVLDSDITYHSTLASLLSAFWRFKQQEGQHPDWMLRILTMNI